MCDEAKSAAITTIIPTFRRPDLLKRAIWSALSQTRRDLIVLVCDNASGDETAAVVAEATKRDSRVRYRCHPKNIGLVANFQYGMSQVETPYFSFLSDDDLLLPWFYELALASLERAPSAMFFASRSIFLRADDGAVRGFTLRGWRPGVYSPPVGL